VTHFGTGTAWGCAASGSQQQQFPWWKLGVHDKVLHQGQGPA